MNALPQDCDRLLIRNILEDIRQLSALGSRIEAVSRRFLGTPYCDDPLIGSKSNREIFTASLRFFDCVTYVESVLALAWAFNERTFIEKLRQIRYEAGVVDWQHRNHYMTTWIKNNVREGLIHNRTDHFNSVSRPRYLNVVDGVSPTKVIVQILPKQRLLAHLNEISSGDLAFFGSTRRNLDVFHCGILFDCKGRIVMRHATRSFGQVVEDNFTDFLRSNRMTGVILVRPETFLR